MVNQEKLIKEIKSLSDSIRQKNRALKLGIGEREKFLETTFRPVTIPLQQIAQNIGKPSIPFEGNVILPISKYEQESQDDAAYKQMQTTDESEVSEESEDTDDLREKEELSAGEEESTKPINLSISTSEEEESINPSNLSKLGVDIVSKGTLGRKYLLKMLHSTQANRKYHTYGARVEDDGLMIGDTKLDINEDDNIIIGNKPYKGTIGLFELIFKNKPGQHNNKRK